MVGDDPELVHDRRRQLPEHGRGGGAAEAVVGAGRRLVDRDQHGHLRILGREEADEARVVHAVRRLVVEVRAVGLGLVPGAGLAGDVEPLDLGAFAGALAHDRAS